MTDCRNLNELLFNTSKSNPQIPLIPYILPWLMVLHLHRRSSLMFVIMTQHNPMFTIITYRDRGRSYFYCRSLPAELIHCELPSNQRTSWARPFLFRFHGDVTVSCCLLVLCSFHSRLIPLISYTAVSPLLH